MLSKRFQFTPVLRRATPSEYANHALADVSIHARLATGDMRKKGKINHIVVSIHARLATGDGECLLDFG